MNKLVKNNLPVPNFKLIQDNLKICCYHCGSREFTKAGKNKKEEQRYRCKDCKRKFIKNAKLQNRNLPLSEDVLSGLN
jgi:transposase-like protein